MNDEPMEQHEILYDAVGGGVGECEAVVLILAPGSSSSAKNSISRTRNGATDDAKARSYPLTCVELHVTPFLLPIYSPATATAAAA
jgi:hypothetical protein